jgi:cytochrome P450
MRWILHIGLGCRRPACYPFLGEGIFTQDGPPWKHSREMLRRQFARVQARDLETFTEQVENLISTFRNSKGIVDLQPAFFRFTLATTTTLLFGESIETLSEYQQEEFAEHFDRASKITAVRLPLADLCFLYNTWGYRKSCRIVKRYADYFVKRRSRKLKITVMKKQARNTHSFSISTTSTKIQS